MLVEHNDEATANLVALATDIAVVETDFSRLPRHIVPSPIIYRVDKIGTREMLWVERLMDILKVRVMFYNLVVSKTFVHKEGEVIVLPHLFLYPMDSPIYFHHFGTLQVARARKERRP